MSAGLSPTTATAGEVEVRWLPGLALSPGAVDLTAEGPLGRVAKAVPLCEALAVSAVLDLLCPASNWHGTVSALAPRSTLRGSRP